MPERDGEGGALWEACVRSRYGVREDELSHAVDAHLERAVVQEVRSEFDDVRRYIELFHGFEEKVMADAIVGADRRRRQCLRRLPRFRCVSVQRRAVGGREVQRYGVPSGIHTGVAFLRVPPGTLRVRQP